MPTPEELLAMSNSELSREAIKQLARKDAEPVTVNACTAFILGMLAVRLNDEESSGDL